METLLPENLCAHRKGAIAELIKSRARKTAAQPQILLGKPTGDHDGLEEVLVELFTSFTKSLSHVLMRSCEDCEVIQIPNQVQSPVGDQRLVDPGESSKRPRPTAKDRRVCSKRRCYFRCTHKFDQGCHHTSRSHSLNKPPQNPKSEARSRSFSSKTISTQDSESQGVSSKTISTQDTSSCPSPVSPVRKECGDGRLQINSLSRDLQDRKDLKIQDDLVHFRKDFEGGVLAENLDGRIQDALGHFQDDFKRGVSVENLGLKFGGYGSFLPTPTYRYHPRTPAKVHDSNAPSHMPKQSTPRDADGPSPARRDSSHPATKVLEDAENLEHQADCHKISRSRAESTGVYFQAAHKFLHGASLLESTNGESVKQRDMIQSMQVYSRAAKLYEYCAHEYEKSNNKAAAALAYKCTEVAYMRLLYSCRSGANIDCHKLQTALDLGESPCWSTSKVDNVNNLPTPDAVPLSKDVSSPQVLGYHVISAQNRPSYSRLLQFTRDVNCALGASRKSQLAFAEANLRKVEAQYTQGITSVKTALDFSFQDMEELLHLVQLEMKAIGL